MLVDDRHLVVRALARGDLSLAVDVEVAHEHLEQARVVPQELVVDAHGAAPAAEPCSDERRREGALVKYLGHVIKGVCVLMK